MGRANAMLPPDRDELRRRVEARGVPAWQLPSDQVRLTLGLAFHPVVGESTERQTDDEELDR